MAERISGRLRVDDRVILASGDGEIEVIIFPLQASIGWEFIVQRSIEAFQRYNGQHVTLEGDMHGGLLVSARIAASHTPRDGMYQGRLESSTGVALHMELRVDVGTKLVSADFFRQGNYTGSMRARVNDSNDRWVAISPRFIFDQESQSAVHGALELEMISPDVFKIDCVLPEAVPDQYTGQVSFESEYFRILNIEVDKLEGTPWPPEYSTADIPAAHQPPGIEVKDVSLASLFRAAGVDARVQHNDAALDSVIGQADGRPREDRWSIREMQEMMDAHYSRGMSGREWWLYLLIVSRFDGGPKYDNKTKRFYTRDGEIVNDGEGTTGIIFDYASGNIRDPWSDWFEYFERSNPQFKHLFDFGRPGSFSNIRARQGSAVFWREMLDFVAVDENWYRQRQFLRTIVHELGHALNLAHTWEVGRTDTTSFMNYPQYYPHGVGYEEMTRNYWRDFDYMFDPEEIFHLCHGFYNEVVPGGRLEFMEWTPASVFRDPGAGGTRSNISLTLQPGKSAFRFTEPVVVDVAVKNHTSESIPMGRLSPSHGDVRYMIKKPSGAISQYKPPFYKCEIVKEPLSKGETKSHLTSLAVGADGFVFDTPGRWEITAAIPDPSSGTLVISLPAVIWVKYPDPTDEEIASRVFDRETGLFLKMAGGEHLKRAKAVMEEVAQRFKEHPFAAHANLVLGLNKIAGHKSIVSGAVVDPDHEGARPYLQSALDSGFLNTSSVERLKTTIKDYPVQELGSR